MITTIELPHSVDPVAIGARTGLLWSGDEFAFAGLGEPERIPLSRPDGAAAAQAALAALDADAVADPGGGIVAFAALPFDPIEPGELLVPPIVVGGDSQGRRWMNVRGGDLDHAHRLLTTHTGPLVASAPPRRRVRSVVPAERWRDEVVTPARDRIRAGELHKAVLARQLMIEGDEPIDVAAVVEGLARRFPATNLFCIDGFVGASPELLVGRTRSTVRAHPLAGTARRDPDPAADRRIADDLLASTKNQWEHRITIDWLLDTLLPFCSYVDAEPEPTIVSLANVHHLGTRVEGRLSDPAASIVELVAALHPTPAVGGEPQATALELIAELEPGDRGCYAGAAGWVDAAGNGAFAVSIRSARIDGPTASLWAGVGVVADSDPEAELAETESKFAAMRSVLTDD